VTTLDVQPRVSVAGPYYDELEVGQEGIAHPALVWDLSIGQSTAATQRVIANLFYRGLELRKAVAVGDTLTTQAEVTALRDIGERPGRGRRGLAALHITTRDQHGEVVLDFHRCAVTVGELHVRVFAERDNGRHAVLDWRPIVLLT